jgi:hypothetical protein
MTGLASFFQLLTPVSCLPASSVEIRASRFLALTPSFPLDLSSVALAMEDDGDVGVKYQTPDAYRFAGIQQNDRIAGVLVS